VSEQPPRLGNENTGRARLKDWWQLTTVLLDRWLNVGPFNSPKINIALICVPFCWHLVHTVCMVVIILSDEKGVKSTLSRYLAHSESSMKTLIQSVASAAV